MVSSISASTVCFGSSPFPGWRNGFRLKDSTPDIRFNALELKERLPAQKIHKGGDRTRLEPETIRRFGWSTDHEITRDNLEGVMTTGRSGWGLEIRQL